MNFGRSTEVTLKSGVLANGNTNTWFKITVPKNGYIVLNKVNWGGREYCLYNSKKRIYSSVSVNNSSNSIIPVTKGTYYLRSNGSKSSFGAAVQMKYTFAADPSKTNYTMKTALPLKAKTKAMSVLYSSAKASTWNRYFKVTLTAKQYLKVIITSSPYRSACLSILDSKGNSVSCIDDYSTGLGRYTSSKKLNKGTYYIVYSERWNSTNKYNTTGSFLQFYWQ